MRFIEIQSPEGAVSLLNIDQIKLIIPFGNGAGCNILMIGDVEGEYRQVGIEYGRVMKVLEDAGVVVHRP